MLDVVQQLTSFLFDDCEFQFFSVASHIGFTFAPTVEVIFQSGQRVWFLRTRFVHLGVGVAEAFGTRGAARSKIFMWVRTISSLVAGLKSVSSERSSPSSASG